MKSIDESIYLRASLSSICNFDCIYCPKELGMENQVPINLKGKILSIEDYKKNLDYFAYCGIQSITFTGGEPALNKDLEILLKHARKIYKNVEITTNGHNFQKNIDIYEKYADKIKLSLDAIDDNAFENITNEKTSELNKIKDSIILSAKRGLYLGINVVVMKSNLPEINKIIDFCSELNNKYKSNIYISLLDLYYAPIKREFWLSNFVPLDIIKDYFIKKRYKLKEDNKFGCSFYWVKIKNVQVRFKDSFSGTQRSSKCLTCNHYCQEGVYSIKHSIEGYCTTCPFIVNEVDDIYMDKYSSKEKSLFGITKILNSLIKSDLELFSFKKFLIANNLDFHAININKEEIFTLIENNYDTLK